MLYKNLKTRNKGKLRGIYNYSLKQEMKPENVVTPNKP
jgi:hypothetical protein